MTTNLFVNSRGQYSAKALWIILNDNNYGYILTLNGLQHVRVQLDATYTDKLQSHLNIHEFSLEIYQTVSLKNIIAP